MGHTITFEEDCNVSHIFGRTRNMTRARGRDSYRFFVQNILNDRYVVHRQIPDYVHIALKKPQARTNAVVIVNSAKRAFVKEFAYLLYGGGVPQRVEHHDGQALLVGLANE